MDSLNQVIRTLGEQDQTKAAIFPHEMKIVFTLINIRIREQRREVMLNSKEQIIDSYLITKHIMIIASWGGVLMVFWVCIAKLLWKITGASQPVALGERGTAGYHYRSTGHGQPKLPAGLTHKDVTTARIKNPLRQTHVRRHAPVE